MRHKPWIRTILISLFGIGLLFGTSWTAEKQTYKVGLVVELTGMMAAGGGECRDGVVIEVERINAAGGINRHPIELVIEDTASEATKAVTAVFEKLEVDDLHANLKNPNNPIILGKKKDFKSYGIDIQFEEEALYELAVKAHEEKTGARGLVSASIGG
jgi:hypothetical protein